MSFAEFGSSSSSSSNANKKRTQQQQQQHALQQQSRTPSPYSGNGGSSLGLDSISESLLQYQRNVDILGKIVRSINTSHIYNPGMNELCLQYEAQVDVVGQLEQKVQNQLQQQLQLSSSSTSTTSTSTNPQRITIITKLKRDLERVQVQAKSLQDAADNKIKLVRSSNNDNRNANNNMMRNNNNTTMHQQQQLLYDQQSNSSQQRSAEAIYAEQQRLIQMQIQEDRLAEEIMREREEEIRNINRGMHQVNEIYKDLAHIVGEQQEQIDTIETQMDDARANAEAGLYQVEKANEKYGSTQCHIM